MCELKKKEVEYELNDYPQGFFMSLKICFPPSMNYSYVLTYSGLTSKTLGRKATKIEGYLLTWMIG